MILPFFFFLVKKQISPPPNFMYVLRGKVTKVSTTVLSSGFPWKEDLGPEWGKGWPNEHTFYFIYFSSI